MHHADLIGVDGFQLFGPVDGYVSRQSFENFVNAIKRSLGAIQFDASDFIKRIFDVADEERQDKINVNLYLDVGIMNYTYIQTLGLIKDVLGMKIIQSYCCIS